MSVRTTDLIVGGMTCAACVGRVERRVGRIAGVRAGVNLATGRARVSHPESVGVEELLAAVEAAGHTAELVVPEEAQHGPATGEFVPLRHVAAVALLAVPVIVLSMFSGLQFDGWQWVCFGLALPVVTWGSRGIHRRAWRALRHATGTMDSLVSLGIAASFGWSVYALFLGGAGAWGLRMPFSPTAAASSSGHHVYLEVAVGVPLFVLCGRALEGRVARRTGSALRALAELAVREASVVDGPGEGRDGWRERRVPVTELVPGMRFVVRPGERVATDGVVVEGASALDVSMVTGESVPVEAAAGDRVVGATLNLSGTLVVRATAVGGDTQLARITRLVVDTLAVPARGELVMTPMGQDVSVSRPGRLAPGQRVEFILRFRHSGELRVTATAVPATDLRAALVAKVFPPVTGPGPGPSS